MERERPHKRAFKDLTNSRNLRVEQSLFGEVSLGVTFSKPTSFRRILVRRNLSSPKRIFLFQNTMNLPPDKVKILSQYDNDKKWDLICDQVGLRKTNIETISVRTGASIMQVSIATTGTIITGEKKRRPDSFTQFHAKQTFQFICPQRLY